MEQYGCTPSSELGFSTLFCSPTGAAYPEISPDGCSFNNHLPMWFNSLIRGNFVVLGYSNLAFILYPTFVGSSTQRIIGVPWFSIRVPAWWLSRFFSFCCVYSSFDKVKCFIWHKSYVPLSQRQICWSGGILSLQDISISPSRNDTHNDYQSFCHMLAKI